MSHHWMSIFWRCIFETSALIIQCIKWKILETIVATYLVFIWFRCIGDCFELIEAWWHKYPSLSEPIPVGLYRDLPPVRCKALTGTNEDFFSIEPLRKKSLKYETSKLKWPCWCQAHPTRQCFVIYFMDHDWKKTMNEHSVGRQLALYVHCNMSTWNINRWVAAYILDINDWMWWPIKFDKGRIIHVIMQWDICQFDLFIQLSS